MISGKEKKQILVDFNDTACAYPRDITIHELFEEQAAGTPDKRAVIFENHTLTYRQLNEKSNRLARLLKHEGVAPNAVVGIMTERSLEMMIGILAILKAGAAYLPLSPAYPIKRIHHMLHDSQAELVLTQGKFLDRLQGDIKIIDLDAEDNYREPAANLPHSGGSQHLAYVIYTSGSTGKPKGVMIEHHSVVNRLYWMQKKYPLNECDILLQKTPFFFDVSVWELFWWAITGAALCFMLPGFEKFPLAIIETAAVHRVSIIHFVPSMLSAFLGYIENSGDIGRLSSLRRVFASGEALKASHVQRFNNIFNKQNGTKLTNLYGPTEATVDVSYYDCLLEKDSERIPIGKPIDNINLFIIDEKCRLSPLEMQGELCISGAGLARGYLNQPRLTADRFIYHSFSQSSPSQAHSCRHNPPGMEKRLYKTGDFARWLTDGNIEFLGRMDEQVKIRGLRIELREIEHALLNHNSILDCVVQVRPGPESITDLIAFVVPQKNFSAEEVKKYLKDLLPEYMVPGIFITMDRFPITMNGKVDRKALIKMEEKTCFF